MSNLNQKDIQKHLTTSILGRKIICLDMVNSTNSEAKSRAPEAVEGTIILSEEQTAGRGRHGRQWISPKGKGIWMSLILRPRINAQKVPQITQIAAAALFLALNQMGIKKVEIKWPNDILVNGRKLSGILTEMQSKGNAVDHVILGIGLNVNMNRQDFPEDLQQQATSLYLETGKVWGRSQLIAEIINAFEPLYMQYVKAGDLSSTLNICKEESAVIGARVLLHNQNLEQEAEVLDLGPEGELIVRTADGTITSIVTGEVSLRVLH
ncbi:MAG: hypothetical protein APF84_19590 [Gracilibacter sp. BRH_c7a]|nr:MAG: hypothetical protein APF84_19590 [Gracilibacter sp. BRH_c7a]